MLLFLNLHPHACHNALLPLGTGCPSARKRMAIHGQASLPAFPIAVQLLQLMAESAKSWREWELDVQVIF